MSSDYSRTELLASKTTGIVGDLLSHLEKQAVIISCDNDPAMVRATRILLTILRRLPIILVFNGSGISAADVDSFHTAVFAVNPHRPLANTTRAGMRLHIGLKAPAGTLRVVPSRHGAHILRNARSVTLAPASPLGSSMAAAFAAAEVFKHVVRVRSDRRSDPPHFAFCPVTLCERPEDAPPFASPFHFSGAIVGLGAIGSATAMILAELDTHGEIDLIDRQPYAKENVTTYSLGGQSDAAAGLWKTALAERALRSARCRRFDDGIEDYVARVQDGSVAPPRIVLAGLDSIEARHETQRLWPDLLIDGATGDTMLGLHVAEGAGQPCMECFLERRVTTASPYARLSELTGLPTVRLRDGDSVLTDADLASVSASQRERLAPLLGRKICGLADAVGLTDLLLPEGFQPSAAFVAMSAACLVVGRAIATELGIAPRENFVQYDALFGPASATLETRKAAAHCYCVTRNKTIEGVRERRLALPR